MFPSALHKLLQGTSCPSLTPKGTRRSGGREKEVRQPTASHSKEVDEEIVREKKNTKKEKENRSSSGGDGRGRSSRGSQGVPRSSPTWLRVLCSFSRWL